MRGNAPGRCLATTYRHEASSACMPKWQVRACIFILEHDTHALALHHDAAHVRFMPTRQVPKCCGERAGRVCTLRGRPIPEPCLGERVQDVPTRQVYRLRDHRCFGMLYIVPRWFVRAGAAMPTVRTWYLPHSGGCCVGQVPCMPCGEVPGGLRTVVMSQLPSGKVPAICTAVFVHARVIPLPTGQVWREPGV